MSDPLQKVAPGDRLQFPAAAWNACLEAAQAERQRQHSRVGSTGSETPSTTIVLVKNSSGSSRSRFDVLALGDPIILPEDNLEEFQRRPTFTGTTPGSSSSGKFCVLLEPLAAGAIGRAVVSGVVPVLLYVDAPEEDLLDFAETTSGQAGYLRNIATGSARVLWAENNGEEQQWALVHLGAGTSTDWFYARLNARTGTPFSVLRYAYVEQTLGADGGFSDTPAGRTGNSTTNTAFERNHYPVPVGGVGVGAIVKLYPGYIDPTAGQTYEFEYDSPLSVDGFTNGVYTLNFSATYFDTSLLGASGITIHRANPASGYYGVMAPEEQEFYGNKIFGNGITHVDTPFRIRAGEDPDSGLDRFSISVVPDVGIGETQILFGLMMNGSNLEGLGTAPMRLKVYNDGLGAFNRELYVQRTLVNTYWAYDPTAAGGVGDYVEGSTGTVAGLDFVGGILVDGTGYTGVSEDDMANQFFLSVAGL